MVDVTQSPGLLSFRPRQCPCSTGCSTPSRHSVRQQRLDVSMSSCSLSPGRTRGGTRGCVAGGWGCRSDRGSLVCLAPFLGLVCSCSEFSEMLVSYLGVDSPAASSPGVLGASFSGYSATAVGASGSSSMPEVGRSCVCRCPGTGGATLMTPPSSTSSLSLGFQAPWSRVASSAWLFRPRSWPLHWPRMVAVARGPALSQTIASRSSVVACVMIACISGNDSVYVYRLERPLPGLWVIPPRRVIGARKSLENKVESSLDTPIQCAPSAEA